MKYFESRQSYNTTGIATLILTCGLFIAGTAGVRAEAIELDSPDFEKSSRSLFQPNTSSKTETVNNDTVIAKVDGEDIVFEDVKEQLQGVLGNVPQNVPQEAIQQQLPSLVQRVLNGIITDKLLKDAVDEENIEVTEEDVDGQIDEIKTQLPEDRKLEDLLKMQGMTMADFRERLKEQLPVQKLIESKTGEPGEPTDEEVTEFYSENKDRFVQPEKVKASHILIGFEEDDDEAQKGEKLEEIKEIRTEIVEEGADFGEMAKEHSTGPSASKDGELGEFQKGQMVPEFEKVAFSQEVGKVSEPVETQFGYHLIKVDERSEEKTVPLEEASEQIKMHLTQKGQQKKVEKYIQDLRGEADIEIVKDLSNIQMNNLE